MSKILTLKSPKSHAVSRYLLLQDVSEVLPSHSRATHHTWTSTVRLGRIDYPQIEWLLFSVTTREIFFTKVAWSPPVSEPLHATFGMKIAPVVAENKRRSIFTSLFWRDKLNINLLAFTCKSVPTPQTSDLHISVNIQPQDKLQSANHPHFRRSSQWGHWFGEKFGLPLTRLLFEHKCTVLLRIHSVSTVW